MLFLTAALILSSGPETIHADDINETEIISFEVQPQAESKIIIC